jgi:hypothetical protein
VEHGTLTPGVSSAAAVHKCQICSREYAFEGACFYHADKPRLVPTRKRVWNTAGKLKEAYDEKPEPPEPAGHRKAPHENPRGVTAGNPD